MPSPELLRELDAAWPPVRRGLLGSKPPADVSPALESVLVSVAASGGDDWVLVFLSLAWESEGALRARLLDGIAQMLARLSPQRWVRIDELGRPAWGNYVSATLPVAKSAHTGLRGWLSSSSLESIHAVLGRHVAVTLLASMHPSGRIREAAVVALDGDVRAIPAMLLRANDWVGPVRDEALRRLHGLVDPAHVDAWLRTLPLLLRLDACGRSSHGPLIDRVGTLFRDDVARAQLLDAVRRIDAPTARAAAAMAVRVFGAADREVVRALLRCPDMLVRYRTVDPQSSVMDGDLLDIALGDPVPAIRRRALDVLRVRNPEQFEGRLRTACFDRSDAVREYAIFHLRKAGRFDAADLVADARERAAAGRGDVLGALLLICDVADDAVEVSALAGHPNGRVRLCAKRLLIGAHRDGEPVDPRLLDDPSPKVARGLISLLRTRGVEPDLPCIARRIEDSPTDVEACAWLGTLAGCAVWGALPHLVRAMGDRRAVVAAGARSHVDAITRRTFRSYVTADAQSLRDLAAAVRECRDPRAAAVAEWVRGVTGQGDWAL